MSGGPLSRRGVVRFIWAVDGVILDSLDALRELPAGWLCLGPPRLFAFELGKASGAGSYVPRPTKLVPLFLPTGAPRVEFRWPRLPALWASDGDPLELCDLLEEVGLPVWLLLVSGRGTVIQAIARRASLPADPLTRLLLPESLSALQVMRIQRIKID